ncbi:MAG: sulfurtransferase TusA family protein [Rubripirellula sp.]|jgi:TusA-related sulfurtransferase|nr:sulfurtransferase TusA family protein [Rubripirellula sp.]MDA8698091.1 sulfurtransferase TusA family protein [Rhodopirellula sp.]MDA9778426.1 sulfurtransferase TusA family protein [Rubripirellula sp.]
MADQVLDCKAISCPMPIVRISKAIKTLTVGQTLEVHATDPSFQADVEAWARRTGNELVSFVTEDNVHTALIRIAG